MMFRVALMSLVRPKAMPSKKAWVERAISRTKEVRLRPSQNFFFWDWDYDFGCPSWRKGVSSFYFIFDSLKLSVFFVSS